MLNKSISLLREKNKTLENMTYRDVEGARIMRNLLFQTDFWGMSVCTVAYIQVRLEWESSSYIFYYSDLFHSLQIRVTKTMFVNIDVSKI